jgi:serine/threonine protein kinase/tetratricopeptide (TPR) repeat protein
VGRKDSAAARRARWREQDTPVRFGQHPLGRLVTHATATLAQALQDRYELGPELGSGGMATVYLAQDLRHERPVAIKVLRPEIAAGVGAERFLREVRLAARLQHPHILPVFDSGEAAGLLWYAMPYVEGESLRHRLARDGSLSLDEALRLAREVADALDYAHRRGVIHRDVKPANILLSDGHALLADFGVARAFTGGSAERSGARDTALTEVGMSVGTPAYMSPEQAMGAETLDGRTDIYALGCVVFEMLAGRPPFSGPNPQAVVARHITEPVPSMRAAADTVPLWVDGAVRRALAKLPDERYSTAGDLARALVPGAPTEVVAGPRGERSIAVLPFANLSPDPENEYFADGMTDELINALAKVPGLRVVSRTSAFAFKGRQQDVRSIGGQLSVECVLEGSVRRAGRRLRTAVQLVNVADGYQLWSETFDRELEDVFAIQDEISRGIVSALKLRLLGEAPGPFVKSATADFEAYTLYLKGRLLWNRRSEDALRHGLAYFEQALERDPNYALAHVGLADSYVLLCFYTALAPAEGFPRAKAAAETALRLDPTLGEAYPALAYVKMYYEWDWAGALRAFRQAIERNPNYATAHQWLGNCLAILGRFEESLASFQRAVELDPLSPIKNAALGWGHYFARRYPEAIAQQRRALEIDADLSVTHLWYGLSLEQTGAAGKAVERFEDAVRLLGRDPVGLSFLAHGLAVAGRRVEAQMLLDELLEMVSRRYVSGYDLAVVHVGLDRPDEAIAWLERGHAERTHWMALMKVDPRLDPLRSDPRFAKLIARMAFS